jgi:glucans biosynthesis protein C
MQANDRLHALDALRAYALLLGIFLHAATPWLKDVDVWPIREQPVDALAVVWFVIHMFRMQVFFLIAGFFGSMVLQRRGMQAFIKDRAKRIVLPFVIGLPAVMILMSLMYVAGFLASGHTLSEFVATVQKLESPQQGPRGGPNAGPLWFLYYLIMYYAGVLILRMVVKSFDSSGKFMLSIDAIVKFLMSGVWGPVLLGLSFAIYFYNQPTWSSWTGVSGPRSFIPNGSLLAYGFIFCLGWLLHRQKELLLQLEKTWKFYCALAVILTVISLRIGGTPLLATLFAR